MPTVKIDCPRCGVRLKVPSQKLNGQSIACPACKRTFTPGNQAGDEDRPARRPHRFDAVMLLASVGSAGVLAVAVLTCVWLFTGRSQPLEERKPEGGRGGPEVKQPDPAPGTGRRYALLVGVRDYKHMPHLLYTENDVNELANLLGPAGYEVVRLTSGAGADYQPTSSTIRVQLDKLAGQCGKSDLLLLAFAGHGIQGDEERDCYFCPQEGEPDKPQTLVSLSQVYARLSASHAGVKLMLVDACRNQQRGGARGIDGAPRPPRGVAALFSCSPNQQAFETAKLGKGHGVFFHFVLEGLRGKAKNDEGAITWDSLGDFVKRQVTRQTPTIMGGGAQQTPHVMADMRGESPVLLSAKKKSPLEQLCDDLHTGDASARQQAAAAIGKFGRGAIAAVPDLARRLQEDNDAAVREKAASALGELVAASKPDHKVLWEKANPALRAAATDPAPLVRRSAFRTLGAFGILAAPAKAEFRKGVRDSDATVRQQAVAAVGKMGKVIDVLLADDLRGNLGDTSPAVQVETVKTVGLLISDVRHLGVIGEGITAALFAAVVRDGEVRKPALAVLASLSGPAHRERAAALYSLLDSKDEEIASGVACVLGHMGAEPAKRALPLLKKTLAGGQPAAQALAAAALANAGPEAVGALDELIRALAVSKDTTVRRNCCIALAHLGKEAKPAIPALAAALKPGPTATPANEEVRELAAEAIAQIRIPHNLGAIDVVRDAIAKDKNQLVRQRCVWALFNLRDLDEHKLTPTLTAVLDDTDEASLMVRYDCARVLAFALSEKVPDKAVDTLLHMLSNDRLRVFNKTAASTEGTLADIGGDARYMAAEALGWLGGKSKNNARVVKALRAAAAAKEAGLSKSATQALVNLGLSD